MTIHQWGMYGEEAFGDDGTPRPFLIYMDHAVIRTGRFTLRHFAEICRIQKLASRKGAF